VTDIHSYSKVWALGHPQLEGLCDEPVLVQEKLDGSQFSFMLSRADGLNTLHYRSKGAIIHGPKAAGMFKPCVEAVEALARALRPGYVYRAEFLSKPRHNVLQYGRTPKHYFVVYDIEDMNQGPYHFLSSSEVLEECARMGVEYVGHDQVAMVRSSEDLAAHMKKPSMLGGPREGVVLKNYTRFTKDGKVMMGKYVSEAFKEVHGGAWKAANPGGKDVVATLIERLKTEARYEKAAQHLRERGELTETVQDIGPLIREVQTDVIAEEADRIKEALYKWAKGQIERGVAGGVPQWWKDKLAGKQFITLLDLDSHSTDACPETEEEELGANPYTGLRMPIAKDTLGVVLVTEMGEGD
jgi:hypothetical protein